MACDQGLLIAGERQESSTGETYDDVNPYTGDAIATVAAAGPATRPGRSMPTAAVSWGARAADSGAGSCCDGRFAGSLAVSPRWSAAALKPSGLVP